MTQIVIRHYERADARRNLWIGLAMAVVAVAFGAEQAGRWLSAHTMAAHGLQLSLWAGLATGLGAIPVLFLRRTSESAMAPALGIAAGMMLAASLFSLLLPAYDSIVASGTPWVLAPAAIAALIAGAAAMQQLDDKLPHAHVETATRQGAPNVALVVAAIAIHNIPEGLAVGVAAAAGADHGMSLGIALQNIPEGWIVAAAMLAFGVTPARAALIALGTGLIEPLGGLFGVLAATAADAALPIALSMAAGAMLWVVGHEMMPSLKAHDRRHGATWLFAGFAAMSVLAGLA